MCVEKDLQEKGESHLVLCNISRIDSNIECFSNLWWNKFANIDRGICIANNPMSTISSMK
jgi:hypothetical protein